MLQLGEKMPAFSGKAVKNGKVEELKLSGLEGKWIVLFFYPKDFTSVCSSEIMEFNNLHGKFLGLKAELIGISVDDIESHKKFAAENKLGYTLLSDSSKELTKKFGILHEKSGLALRGTFIFGPDGTLRHEVVHELGIARSMKETLRVLQALQTGELCQAEWQPGQKTLGKMSK